MDDVLFPPMAQPGNLRAPARSRASVFAPVSSIQRAFAPSVSKRDFRIKSTRNQVRQGVRPRAGAPAGFPNLLTSPPRSNPANRPGPQTMPECRFNKHNATSKNSYTVPNAVSLWTNSLAVPPPLYINYACSCSLNLDHPSPKPRIGKRS